MATAVEEPAPDQTQKAGRGGLALAGGKVFFLVAGLLQQILLKSILGLGGYGALSTAQSVASICYNPLVQAGIQGVSRETAGLSEDAHASVFRRLLSFHAIVAAVGAGAFFAAADDLSSWLGAPHVASAVRILSAILFVYGLYAPMIGYLNGRRRFLAQAGLDVFAASLRTIGLVAGAYWASSRLVGVNDPAEAAGVQVSGTVTGFALAGIVILLVATRFTGLGSRGGKRPSTKSYSFLIGYILLGQVLLNVLFQADALLLRKFASSAALTAGLDVAAADPYVGAYRATQLFCFLPFQLLTSLTFVLFPLLASARSGGQQHEVAALVSRGLRLALLVAGLIVTVIIAVPAGLLALVFGAEASQLGAASMRVLAVGMGFFALLGVMTSALNSLGHEVRSLLIVLAAVLLVGTLGIGFAQGAGLSELLLMRIATATSLALFAATVGAAWVLHSVSQAHMPLFSLLRTGAAMAASSWLVSRFVGQGVVMTLLGALAAGALFCSLLVLTKELTREDWLRLRKILGR